MRTPSLEEGVIMALIYKLLYFLGVLPVDLDVERYS
jgi:hypothetical protein